MSDHSIRSLNVEFPFQPYECQLTYMEKVVESLQTCQNALLESPTGTGKVSMPTWVLRSPPSPCSCLQTLSLLCAALSWQRAYGAALQLAKTHGWSADLADSTDGKVLGGDVPVSPDTPLDQQQEAHGMRVDLRKAAGSLRLPLERRPLKQESEGGFASGGIRVGGRSYKYDGDDAAGSAEAEGRMKPPSVFDALPHKPSVVIYSSRTHSQLSQVVKELKRTSFRPRVSVLGSRSQLCVHPKVAQMEGQMQSNACKALCKTRACMPRNNLNDFLALGNSVFDLPHAHWSSGKDRTLQVPRRRPKEDEDGNVPLGASAPLEPVVSDIEDLVSLGREKEVCPYFAMREVAALEQAQLVLMPYNYLVDPAVRQSLDINWANAVIIFDEGHNIESVAGDAASFDLSALDIAQCIQEMHSIAQAAAASTSDNASEADVTTFTSHFDAHGDADNVLILKNIFLMIEGRLASEELPTEKDSPGAVFEGRYIYELMQSWNITFETHDLMDGLIGKCLEWLSSRDASAIGGGSISRGGREMGLAKFRKILGRIFSSPETAEQLATNYKMVIHEKQPTGTGFGGRLRKAHRVLSYWCFSPGVAMHELQALGVRSFIVTSGTLAPMASYTAELQLPFPIQLENSHVIHPSQLMLRILERGPGMKTLSSAYENRNKAEYKEEIGKVVVNLCRLVPNGMLVFFPSFSALRSCVEHWRLANGGVIWDSLKREKEPVVEGERASNAGVRSGNTVEPPQHHSGAAAFQTNARSTAQQASAAASKAKQFSSGFAVVASDGSGGFGGGGRGAGGGTRIIGRADVLSGFVPNITATKSGAGSSQGDAFAEMIKKFNDNAGTDRGAVLLAVCRGRASEGIDFSDAKARAVVITGIPYPPLHDAKVKLKRQHLDGRMKEESMASMGRKPASKHAAKTLSGSDWYVQQAARAVNQAVGRVIRHRFDYGAIILADSRFAAARGSSSAHSQLSRWLQPYISVASKYGELPRSLVQFYQRNARAETLRAQAAREAAGVDASSAAATSAPQLPQAVSMVPEDLIADLGIDLSTPQAATVAETFGNAAALYAMGHERPQQSDGEAFQSIAGELAATAPKSLRERFQTQQVAQQPAASSTAPTVVAAPKLRAVAKKMELAQSAAAGVAASSLKALFNGDTASSSAARGGGGLPPPPPSATSRGQLHSLSGSFVDRMLKQQSEAAAVAVASGKPPPMGRAVRGGAFGLKRSSGNLPTVSDASSASSQSEGRVSAQQASEAPRADPAPCSGPQQLIQDIRAALKKSTVMVRGVVLKSYSVFRDALQGMRAAKDDEHFLYNLRKCAQACHVVAGGTPGSPPSMPMAQRVQLMERLVAQLPSARRGAAAALLQKLTGSGGVKSAIDSGGGSGLPSASKRARTS